MVGTKEIVLKFIGTGIESMYQACVYICDACGAPVYYGPTYDGSLTLCLRKNTVYKIYAKNMVAVFYVSDEENVYTFSLINSFPNLKTITFQLTDANYSNLPIKKGEIILCQKQ